MEGRSYTRFRVGKKLTKLVQNDYSAPVPLQLHTPWAIFDYMFNTVALVWAYFDTSFIFDALITRDGVLVFTYIRIQYLNVFVLELFTINKCTRIRMRVLGQGTYSLMI